MFTEWAMKRVWKAKNRAIKREENPEKLETINMVADILNRREKHGQKIEQM